MSKPKPIPLMFRIPPELHAKLTAKAKRNGHSLNQELLIRMERSFNDDRDALMAFLIRDAIAVEACLGG